MFYNNAPRQAFVDNLYFHDELTLCMFTAVFNNCHLNDMNVRETGVFMKMFLMRKFSCYETLASSFKGSQRS